MEPILKVVGLRKSYKKHFWSENQTILNELGFELHQGTSTAFLGHNGAGKTTTIRIILGIISAQKGAVYFKGNPLKVKDKSNIGYMPENNKLPANLNSMEILNAQLSSLGVNSKERAEKIDLTLKEVGLFAQRKKLVREMSKGMGRRLAWAQATIHNPELIILDEPFSGLDPLGRLNMEKWILDKKQAGVTLLIATHELSSSNKICDHFFVINSGQKILEGNSSERAKHFGPDEITELFTPLSFGEKIDFGNSKK